MSCCIEPLIALAGGASIISTIMGVVSGDFMMILGGAAALLGIVGGYLYYKSKIQNSKSKIS